MVGVRHSSVGEIAIAGGWVVLDWWCEWQVLDAFEEQMAITRLDDIIGGWVSRCGGWWGTGGTGSGCGDSPSKLDVLNIGSVDLHLLFILSCKKYCMRCKLFSVERDQTSPPTPLISFVQH